MHKIDLSNKNIYTDLIFEKENTKTKSIMIDKNNNLKVQKTSNCTTIYYEDITDKDNYIKVQKTFVNELNKYLNTTNKDIILVIGLGNRNSTPDSLGPTTIDNILVTRHLFLLDNIDSGYNNVSKIIPNVMANTGIETSRIIKSIIKEIKATKVIIIDSLKTSNIERLIKTIQITNKGISPGSGIGNNREEINKKNMNTEIIVIGVPTVVDINGYIVTPTNIDFIIEKLSILLGNGINMSLHKSFNRQNNN